MVNKRDFLRRPDWLDELHGLLRFLVILTGIAGVVRTAAMLTRQPLDVEVDSAGMLRPDALVNAPPGVSISSDLRLHVADPTGVQVAWEMLSTLPSHALVTVALVLLWRLVGRARDGDPFTGGMVGGFRALGIVLVVGGPLVWVVEFIGRFALSATLPTGGPYAPLDFAVPAAWLLCGFGMFAVGEIIRRGRALRAELDGVV